MGNIYGYFLILKDYRFMIYKHINPDNGRIFASVSPLLLITSLLSSGCCFCIWCRVGKGQAGAGMKGWLGVV